MLKYIWKKLYGSGIGNYFPFNYAYKLYVFLVNKLYGGVKLAKINYWWIVFWMYIIFNMWNNVSKKIFLKWVHEKALTEYFINNVKKWDYFLDLWANLWYFSLLSSKLVWNNWKIIAFEPVKQNYELFEKSIKYNWFENIQLEKYALWNKQEEMKINISNKNMWEHSIVNKNETFWNTEKISIKRFDDLDFNIDKSKIKFIKIDIEWFEFEAMKWMKKLLDSNGNIKIVMEFSPEFYKNFWKNYTDEFIKFIYDKWFKTYSFDDNLKEIDLYRYRNIKQLNILLTK